jgi:hypothetical protein
MKVMYFLAEGTVDDLLWPLVQAKMKVRDRRDERNSRGWRR